MWELEKFYWENVWKKEIPVTWIASEFRIYNPAMGKFNYNFVFEKYPEEVGKGGIVGK